MSITSDLICCHKPQGISSFKKKMPDLAAKSSPCVVAAMCLHGKATQSSMHGEGLVNLAF